ncbi:hypothetical protein EOA88_19810, partial [Mesorhizobium sp. M5C.F.Ca.IN.020.14.1.1]
ARSFPPAGLPSFPPAGLPSLPPAGLPSPECSDFESPWPFRIKEVPRLPTPLPIAAIIRYSGICHWRRRVKG